MTNWLNRLELGDIWELERQNKIDAPTLAGCVAERIEAHPLHRTDKELQAIAADFRDLSETDGTFDDTNCVYEMLCQWGDAPDFDIFSFQAGKRCWINTFKPPTKAQQEADALTRDAASQRALDDELGINFNGAGE